MADATFTAPDLTAFARLDRLGLVVTGQRIEPGRAVLTCDVAPGPDGIDDWCRACGCAGRVRDTVTRRLAHEPLGWRPTVLLVRVRRYACTGCSRVWRQDTSRAAAPRAKLSRGALAWALHALVVAHMSVAQVANALGVAWNTANDAVLAEGRRVLIEDDTRFHGVRVLGVDEHVWRHSRPGDIGDKYVTVIIDLTPVHDQTGPARLLDMVEGRSAKVFTTWLQARPDAWRKNVQVVAMVPRTREVPPGFIGYKTAVTQELAAAVTVLDPFHVVKLAADALDDTRRRVQQATRGHRGRAGDPLYRARRTLLTGVDLLTNTQKTLLASTFAPVEHTEVEVTWAVYQALIAAYRTRDRAKAKQAMHALITSISSGVPTALIEVHRLGRTLARRADDVLAYFDHPGTSNGPPKPSTDASNTSAAPPSASATSPTTSPAASSKPAASDPNYTPDCEEPVKAIPNCCSAD